MMEAFAQGQGIEVSLDRFGPSLGGELGSLVTLICVGLILFAIKLSMKRHVWRRRRRR